MKLAVVGTGSIVDTFIQATEAVERIRVTAVYSRSRDRGNALAKRYAIPMVETDFATMLSSENVDTVYIALPNSLHFEYAKLALLAGKHVILEKPFASNADLAEKLFEIADQNNKMIFEAMSVRFQPLYKRTKTLMASLGRIKMIQAQYSQRSSRYDRFVAGELPNVFNPYFDGGALMDLNVYNISFITGLFGTPRDVSYFANQADNGIDTSGIAVLRYEGFVAAAIAAKDSEGESFAVIQGDAGYLKIEGPVSICSSITQYDQSGNKIENWSDDAENRLSVETAYFSDVIETQNIEAYRALCSETLQTMRVIDRLKSSLMR
jgi:predicted dehydrogenase